MAAGLLLLAACTTSTPEPSESESGPASQPAGPAGSASTQAGSPEAPASTASGPLGEAQSCTNEEIGFTVEYPGDWWVNELIEADYTGGTDIPACTYFARRGITIEPGTQLPVEVAIWIDTSGVNAPGDVTTEELSTEETTVDGYDAVVLEFIPSETGFTPEGTIIYTYMIDRDGELIAATTNAYGHEDDYEENKRILDAMMESLDLEE